MLLRGRGKEIIDDGRKWEVLESTDLARDSSMCNLFAILQRSDANISTFVGETKGLESLYCNFSNLILIPCHSGVWKRDGKFSGTRKESCCLHNAKDGSEILYIIYYIYSFVSVKLAERYPSPILADFESFLDHKWPLKASGDNICEHIER